MADPVDEIMAHEAALLNAPPVDPDPAPAAGATISLSQEAYDRMIAEQQSLKTKIEGLEQADSRVRDIAPTPPATPPSADDFFLDPREATDRRIRELVGPQAREMNVKLARMSIQNFKSTKNGNAFFGVAMPIFDRRIEKEVDLAWLGSLPDSAVTASLTTIWNAAVGEYSDAKRAAMPVTPPQNLGGGSGASGGGLKEKKTLREIDEGAWIIARQSGQTEEEMQQTADEILAERE